jgi:hypothetical protein
MQLMINDTLTIYIPNFPIMLREKKFVKDAEITRVFRGRVLAHLVAFTLASKTF